jgi:hypothetical protein
MAIDEACALCSPRRACEFHAAGSVQELGRAVVAGIRKKGAMALARFVTSAIAGIERGISPEILDAIGDLEVTELESYVQRKLSAKAEMSPNDLRELAGCFIALAILADDEEEEEDE